MPIPRIHVESTLGPGAQFSLAPEAAQHVAKALRLEAGDCLVVFDGLGGEYDAAIQRIDRGRVDVKVGAWRETLAESRLDMGLVQALPEAADKMDWIIQKATELGIAWIQPVSCERSVVRLSGERAERREAHWRRVAIAACEQSGRSRIPEVRGTLQFMTWMALSPAPRRWLLDPHGAPVAGKAQPLAPFELMVGPEGGLSERERDLALARGCEPVALGPRVLRTETAALAGLAAIHALWGDFRG
ncbi:MAG: 16S rRNA (uracil(1498)-N(3))-methyltransferase [Usitatibacter sp.]